MGNEIKIGVFLNYTSIVVRLLTQFLLTPFVIYHLGVDEYGLFMLCNSIIIWLSLTDLGIGASITKYVVTYRAKKQYEQQAHFLGQITILFSFLGLITAFLGSIFFIFLDDIFSTLNENQINIIDILYLLTLSNLIISFPLRPINSIPGAYQKFILPGFVSLATSILNAGLTIVLLIFDYKSIGLTVLAITLGLIKLIWNLYYSTNSLKVKFKFCKPDIPLYKEICAFSIWILLSQLMDLFYWRTGTPILAIVSGTQSVALFTLGITLAQIFMTASSAIAGVVAPKLVQMVALDASKEALTNVMIRAGRAQLCILVLIITGFGVLGKDFLHLWVGNSIGEKAAEVWVGTLVVLVPLLIPLTQNAGLAILQALNIHKGRAIILFYTSLVCVVLGYLLSLHFGFLGMFIGTAISLTLGQIIMINIYYSRRAGLHIRQFFMRTYRPIILPVCVIFLFGFLIQNTFDISDWKDFILSGGLFTIIGSITLWLLYMNKEEKQIFITPFKRIFHLR